MVRLLVKNVTNPQLYLDLLSYSQVSEQMAQELLKVYTKENSSFTTSRVTKQKLKESV